MTECYLYKSDTPAGVRSYWKSYVFRDRGEAVAWARAWARYQRCRAFAELYAVDREGYVSVDPYEIVFVGRWTTPKGEKK